MNLTALKTFPSKFGIFSSMERSSRLAVYIILSVFGLFSFLFMWSAIAQVEEITRGDGKVIPSKKNQSIQSSESGVVQEIFVRAGQRVSKGEVLIRLDSTMTGSNLGEVEAKMRSLMGQVARLRIEQNGDPNAPFVCPEELRTVAVTICETEARLLEVRREDQRRKLASFQERIEQRQRELNEGKSNAVHVAQSLALTQQEFDLVSPLAAKNLAPKTDLLRVQRAFVELKGQQSSLVETIAKSEAALREAQNNLVEADLQIKQDVLADVVKLSAELSVLKETTKGAEEHNRRTDIRSPVDGIVNTLDVNTVGAFVNPGAHVMDIVPIEDKLLIETRIQPRDIAFIKPGQETLVKLTAYDFSIFGGLKGIVRQVSADSVYDEKLKQTFYTVLVSTDKNFLKHSETEYPIMPGMISQVDILTGRKTILSYILKPFIKARSEALTER